MQNFIRISRKGWTTRLKLPLAPRHREQHRAQGEHFITLFHSQTN